MYFIEHHLNPLLWSLKNHIELSSKRGELVNAEIFKGVHPDLDSEALHVIKSSPLWETVIQSGVRVSITYIFPINFVLHH